ncbi:TIR domain-containing protein [Frankia sp. Cas4]|uniref:WD40 domain-containing protein n=1 Tax=Frankia sp. Cas4 TaxID=3073927 RepID=UPI002AD25E1A|nr:TIR domain-containing protein [Frankia sp. Cas4]
MVNGDDARLPTVFVSYTQADRTWAEWIAWELDGAGYDVRIQAWHSAPSTNWAAWMQRTVNEADHTLVVLSPDALRSDYVEAEWQAAFRDDPLGRRRRLIPVRVAPLERPGLLGGYTWIDLVGLSEDPARAALLSGVRAAHTDGVRPAQQPAYPGGSHPGGSHPGGSHPDGGTVGEAPAFPGGQYRSATARFLDIVEQACGDRYPGAIIRRVAQDDPVAAHLFVTREESGFVRRWPVGIAPAGLNGATFDQFVEQVHEQYEERDPEVESELVHGGEVTDAALVRRARRRGVLVRSVPEFQQLWDPRRYLRRQAVRLEDDVRYRPSLYVPQRYVRLDQAGSPDPDDNVFDAVVDWLDAESARLILVLGNFGHGKTFLLRELARRLPRILPNLVPVFIELRALEKNHSLDALLAQHLAVAGEESIDIRAVRRMLARGQLVLLFDGFDELAIQVTYDRAAEHLRTILTAVTGRAKVVLSSRTQHFASDTQWRTTLGDEVHLVAGSRLVELGDFADNQIRDFLSRLYGGDTSAADRRLELIRDIKDLLGLSRNPRMLSFIADLDEDELRAVRAAGGGISSADLYENLIARWLRFEVNRRRPTLGAIPGLDVDQIRRAVTALALQLWRGAERDMDLSRLEETARLALADMARGRLDPAQAVHEIGAGSLLVRGDEDRFGFVHSSVMEYLVALEVARLLHDGEPVTGLLASRDMSALMADFLCGAAGRTEAENWARTVYEDPAATDAARANALAVTRRLQIRSIRVRLAGQDLRGKDDELSGLDLRFADLSGADLTGVRLHDADLTGANLTGARLVDAVLHSVVLNRADLCGADLTGARLIKGAMHGAALERSRWRRAALLGVEIDAPTLARPELAEVAVAGRDPVRVVLRPPGAQIRAVVFSPSTTLLAAAWGPVIAMIEPWTGRVVRTLTGHVGEVRSVAFSPDGTVVASGSADGTIHLWDALADDARVVRRIDAGAGEVRSVAFSPDGTVVASGSADGTIHLWNAATGEAQLTAQGHAGGVGSVAVSPDGTLLASGGADQIVRIWDTATGEVRHAMAGHAGWVESVAFSPDGRQLATGGFRLIRLWDVATGEQTGVLPGHAGGVWSVVFSPDAATVASGGADDSVRLWRLTTQRHGILAGHGHSARVWSVAFSPDGTLLASGGADGTVRVSEVATGRRLSSLHAPAGPGVSAALSPDGTLLAAGGAGPALRVWEVATGRQLGALAGPPGGSSGRMRSVGPVAFSPDGRLLAGGEAADPRADGSVRLWEVTTGRPLAVLPGHDRGLAAVVFSPDGRWLASRDGPGRLRLWDVTDPGSAIEKSQLAPPDCQGIHGPVAFTPAGHLLAATGDGSILRWDVAAGRELARLPGDGAAIRTLAVHVDGGLLAASDGDRIRLWDLPSARSVKLIGIDPGMDSGPTGLVRPVALRPDGTLLASGGADGTIRLHEPATGLSVSRLGGHVGAVHTVAFTPNGALLVSAGADGTVRLWDVRSARPLSTMLGLGEGGWCLVLPDGGYQLAGDLADAFWWVLRDCAFGPGELDGVHTGVRRLGDREQPPGLTAYPRVSGTVLGIPIGGVGADRNSDSSAGPAEPPSAGRRPWRRRPR